MVLCVTLFPVSVASKLDLSSDAVSITLFRSIFGTLQPRKEYNESFKMSRFASTSHSHTSKQNLTSSSKGHQTRTDPTKTMLGDTRVAGSSPSSESQFHIPGFPQDTFSQKRKREMVEEKPQDAVDYDSDCDDDKEEMKPKPGKKTRGRVKIHMEYIPNKLRRYTTFSKRKSGMMKKAYELSTLTGTQVMLLVASETGHVYTFATPKLQPMITSDTGKALIQTCLNSPDPMHLLGGDPDVRMSQSGYEETDLAYPPVNEEDTKLNDLPPTCSGMSQMSTILGSPVVGLNAYSIAQMPFQQTTQQGFPIISSASMPQSTPLMPLPPHLQTSGPSPISNQALAQSQRSPVHYGHPVATNHQTSPHGIIVDDMPHTPISAGGSPLNSNSPVHLLHPHTMEGLDVHSPHAQTGFNSMVSNPSRTHSPSSIYSSPNNSPQQSSYMNLNRSPIPGL